jgi:hypothetical protein
LDEAWQRSLGNEVKSFDTAFRDFLEEFYYFKRSSFFRYEPPKEFSPRERAFLRCDRGVPVPPVQSALFGMDKQARVLP